LGEAAKKAGVADCLSLMTRGARPEKGLVASAPRGVS
jgi:hypothetical protein